MHWDKVYGKRRRSFRSDRPLQRLLREYVEEHKDALEAEARQRHSRAQKGLPRHVTLWPLSKAEWVRWLEQEQATYENALQSARDGARRAVNVRVTPHPDVLPHDPAIRVQPHTDTGRPPPPAWARDLRNGWHVLRAKDTGARVVIFVARCAGKLLAFARALVALMTPR